MGSAPLPAEILACRGARGLSGRYCRRRLQSPGTGGRLKGGTAFEVDRPGLAF